MYDINHEGYPQCSPKRIIEENGILFLVRAKYCTDFMGSCEKASKKLRTIILLHFLLSKLQMSFHAQKIELMTNNAKVLNELTAGSRRQQIPRGPP